MRFGLQVIAVSVVLGALGLLRTAPVSLAGTRAADTREAARSAGDDASVLRFQAGVTFHVGDVGSCPVGTSPLISCYRFAGQTVVPGLALASFDFRLFIDRSDPKNLCSTWTIKDGVLFSPKGSVRFVGQSQGCQPIAEGGSGTFQYQFTGGDGPFAAASGSGTAAFAAGDLVSLTSHAQWTGTLDVPGYTFDTAEPTFSRVAKRVVKIPRGRGAHVRYAPKAQDAIDGSVPVTCTPQSGSFFALGRSRVTCLASDTSGNTATASFLVIVKRRH
jgi:HYR domain-containing protein